MLRQAAEAVTSPDGPFYGYPPWLVILVGALVAALALWLFVKLVKWMIYILIVLVLVGGVVTAVKFYLDPESAHALARAPATAAPPASPSAAAAEPAK